MKLPLPSGWGQLLKEAWLLSALNGTDKGTKAMVFVCTISVRKILLDNKPLNYGKGYYGSNAHRCLFRRGLRRMGLGKNCVKKISMTGAKMKLMLLLPGFILSW
jgi:hypothetical protein